MIVRNHSPDGSAVRRGFTLVEVMVALVVGAVVLTSARALFVEIAAGVGRVTSQAREADETANAERLLRALTVRLEVGTDSTRQFGGDERAAHFTSWCDMPSGWQERCPVTISFDTLDGRVALRMVHGGRASVVVVRGLSDGSLRYLGTAADGGTWFRSWGTGPTAPLAIGAICRTDARVDTLILRIGERG